MIPVSETKSSRIVYSMFISYFSYFMEEFSFMRIVTLLRNMAWLMVILLNTAPYSWKQHQVSLNLGF